MNRFNDLWKQVEKYVIYILGSTFVLFPLLDKILYWKIDQTYILFLLGLLILLVFRYIDKNINIQRQSDITSVTKFTPEIVGLLATKKINKLCILAHTGDYYYRAILESEPQIDELHLLLRNFDNPAKVGFPTEVSVRKRYKKNWEEPLKSWTRLKDKGFIKKIIIHRYDFDSFLHFMLIDDSLAHFGLLKPLKNYPGSEVLKSFKVSNESMSGKDLIANFANEFNSIFENFSEECLK